jgi:hypothetical protein
MSNKKPNYEKISRSLVAEFVKIFGDFPVATLLLRLGCSYTDLIALGINKEDAHDAMIEDVIPKGPTESLDLEIVDEEEND